MTVRPPADTDSAAVSLAEQRIHAARPSWFVAAAAAIGCAALAAFEFHNAGGTLRWLAPVVAVPIGIGLAWASAQARVRGRETDRFFFAFAEERGWIYLPQAPLVLSSPLLAAGGRQSAGRGFAIPLDGTQVRLYEHDRIDGSGKDRTVTSYVVLLVPAVTTRAVGLRIRPRHGFRAPDPDLRPIELESTELSERFVVEAPRGLADAEIRELVTPIFITAVLDLADAECYLGSYLEIGVGYVLFASLGSITLEDGAYLDATIPAVTPLLDKLLAVDQATPA
jgi:hypothetical protein